MAAITDITAKLQNLITVINSKTGEVDATLTAAVNHLIDIADAGGGTVVNDAELGKKLYSFGALSDIHMNESHMLNAEPYLKDLGAEFIAHCGDVLTSTDTTTKDMELAQFRAMYDTNFTLPFYSCTGNHDCSSTEEAWEEYIGHPINYDFTYNGDVFLFLSLDPQDYAATFSAPYTNGLIWLREKLEQYAGARIFLFMHLPPSGYSGLTTSQYYGFTSDCTEDDELITLINQTKNVTVFTGHSHIQYASETELDYINIYRFNAFQTALVHVSSVGYPRIYGGTSLYDQSEGYLVECYENAVVITALDFITKSEMVYKYYLHLPQTEIKNSIMCNIWDAYIEDSVTFKVKLSSGAGTVSLATNNEMVTLSVDKLVFTEENYDTWQTVTATFASNEYTNCIVTMSADDATDRSVSLTSSAEQGLIDVAFTYYAANTGIVLNGTEVAGYGSVSNVIEIDHDYDYYFTFGLDYYNSNTTTRVQCIAEDGTMTNRASGPSGNYAPYYEIGIPYSDTEQYFTIRCSTSDLTLLSEFKLYKRRKSS